MCQHSHILKNEFKKVSGFLQGFRWKPQLKQKTCKKFVKGSDSSCSQVNSTLCLNGEWQVMELFSPPWLAKRVQSPSRCD